MRPTTFKVGNTIYWSIRTFTDAGVLVDADSTPTVAVRKNGASTADVVTVTKRAATTGIYDCSYDPASEAEGDCFTIEETATVSAQAYENAWGIEAQAAERGTDSAILAADKPTNFNLLAINGSGEVTTSNPASGGGSAHTAQDVADLILVTPANKLTTDASGNVEANNMRGTDGANTVVPNTVAPDNAGIAANNAAIVALNDLSASDVENAVWDATVSSHVVANSYGLMSLVALNSNRTIQVTGSNHVAADVHDFQANSLTSAATDASFVTEIQSGLSTFDSTTDQVVASNMRGTDNALLAVSAPANWSTLIVGTGADAGKVTTSNPAAGSGSAHTAQDVANLILVTPANKLATDASGDVAANNMRGTDGANTVAPDNASIALVLADTDELQGNQGDWATADLSTLNDIASSDVVTAMQVVADDFKADVSGLSTFDHTADTVANVSTVGSVSSAVETDTASRNASKADVSGLSTFDHASDQVVASNMRGTDGANTIAPVDVSSDVAAILNDTNELQQNQGDWLTATGFATPADVTASEGVVTTAIGNLNDFDPASDVVARVTLVDTTTDLTNGGGGGGSCPTVQEIVDAWGNQDQSVYVTQGTLGYNLDAQVSSAGSGGSGLYQATVRVQDISGNALQGARVNVDGTTLTLVVGTSGEVTFNLDSGIYLFNVSPPANYDTPSGQVVTVTTSDPSDTVFSLTETTPSAGCDIAWL